MVPKSLAAIGIVFLLPLNLAATALTRPTKPRYKIVLITIHGNKIQGILLDCSADSVSLYPGKFSDLKHQKGFNTVTMSVKQVRKIHIKKRHSMIRRALISIPRDAEKLRRLYERTIVHSSWSTVHGQFPDIDQQNTSA